MFKLRYGLLVLGGLVALATKARDQEPKKGAENKDSIAGSAQITFIYPMGSNGLEAYKKSNRLSLNLYAGLNGDVEGVEIGGFANVTNGQVNGVQAAGFANVVKKMPREYKQPGSPT